MRSGLAKCGSRMKRGKTWVAPLSYHLGMSKPVTQLNRPIVSVRLCMKSTHLQASRRAGLSCRRRPFRNQWMATVISSSSVLPLLLDAATATIPLLRAMLARGETSSGRTEHRLLAAREARGRRQQRGKDDDDDDLRRSCVE